MRHDKYLLDDDGNPVVCEDLLEWAEKFEVMDRKVALDEPVPGVEVSTVFLGLDYNYGDGPPLLYETMAFGDSELGDATDRYSTREEALAGHKAMVARVIEAEKDPS